MSDDYGAQGLNGIEIIDDLLAQLRKRLLGDCNLRPTDNYSRGYSAKLTYAVQCYGLDQSAVDGELAVGKEQDDPDTEVVEGKLDIEQEDDIDEVRHRTAKAAMEAGDEEHEEEVDTMERTADGTPVRAKRKYTRKVQQLASPVAGGAEEFKE